MKKLKPIAEGFDRFWDGYPKHMGRQDAEKAFQKLAPSSDLVDKMLDTLSWQARSLQWTRSDGQFIPYPASWLRARRWEDEPHRRTMGLGGSSCPHTPPCERLSACITLTLQQAKAAREA